MKAAAFTLIVLIWVMTMPTELEAQIYARSPEVHSDRTVTFRYFAPKAQSISLQGNVPEISGDLVKNSDGIWSITVGPLAPDTYPYHFSVDKAKVLDPVNRHTKAWMWMDNLVDIAADISAGETPAIHQVQDVPHGSVHMNFYRSDRLDQTRRVFVYTPPGYETNRESYPVLYLLHGFGDDESAWTQVGQAHHIADNCLAKQNSVPTIIVMPLGHVELPTSPDYQAYPLMDNMAAMEVELLKGVIPFVEETYRCKPSRDSRAIAGLSMGGGQSLQFGINNLDQFGWVAGFSSSITKQQVDETAKRNLENLKSKKTWIWIGCGKDDFLFDETVSFDRWLVENEITHETQLTEGSHNWRCWRRYLETVLSATFKDN